MVVAVDVSLDVCASVCDVGGRLCGFWAVGGACAAAEVEGEQADEGE